jgi:hypothetical protein
MPHPGNFEMQILQALTHLREASKVADDVNHALVQDAIHILRQTCCQQVQVAKILEEPWLTPAPGRRG